MFIISLSNYDLSSIIIRAQSTESIQDQAYQVGILESFNVVIKSLSNNKADIFIFIFKCFIYKIFTSSFMIIFIIFGIYWMNYDKNWIQDKFIKTDSENNPIQAKNEKGEPLFITDSGRVKPIYEKYHSKPMGTFSFVVLTIAFILLPIFTFINPVKIFGGELFLKSIKNTLFVKIFVEYQKNLLTKIPMDLLALPEKRHVVALSIVSVSEFLLNCSEVLTNFLSEMICLISAIAFFSLYFGLAGLILYGIVFIVLFIGTFFIISMLGVAMDNSGASNLNLGSQMNITSSLNQTLEKFIVLYILDAEKFAMQCLSHMAIETKKQKKIQKAIESSHAIKKTLVIMLIYILTIIISLLGSQPILNIFFHSKYKNLKMTEEEKEEEENLTMVNQNVMDKKNKQRLLILNTKRNNEIQYNQNIIRGFAVIDNYREELIHAIRLCKQEIDNKDKIIIEDKLYLQENRGSINVIRKIRDFLSYEKRKLNLLFHIITTGILTVVTITSSSFALYLNILPAISLAYLPTLIIDIKRAAYQILLVHGLKSSVTLGKKIAIFNGEIIIGNPKLDLSNPDIDKVLLKKQMKHPGSDIFKIRFSEVALFFLRCFGLIILENSYTVLIGDSGSGKTTIMNMLSLLSTMPFNPNLVQGSFKFGINQYGPKGITKSYVNAKDVDIENFRKQIIYISQEDLFVTNSTLYEVVTLSCEITDEYINMVNLALKIALIIDKVSTLPNGIFTNMNITSFSGGEKRRLFIAIGIFKALKIQKAYDALFENFAISYPKTKKEWPKGRKGGIIFFCDEMLSGLDLITSMEIMKTFITFVESLRENGYSVSVISIEHNIMAIRKYADKIIYCINNGNGTSEILIAKTLDDLAKQSDSIKLLQENIQHIFANDEDFYMSLKDSTADSTATTDIDITKNNSIDNRTQEEELMNNKNNNVKKEEN